MNSRILLKSQKNELFEMIKDQGFNPQDFRWIEMRSTFDTEKTVSRLVCDGTDYFYSFEMQGEAHLSIFCPALHSYVGTDYPGTWDNQKISFSNWLINLFKEKNEPDLWNANVAPQDVSTDMTHETYVTAEPSPQSPAPEQISTRIDALFDQKNTVDRPLPSGKSLQPNIRRYYGKV